MLHLSQLSQSVTWPTMVLTRGLGSKVYLLAMEILRMISTDDGFPGQFILWIITLAMEWS